MLAGMFGIGMPETVVIGLLVLAAIVVLLFLLRR